MEEQTDVAQDQIMSWLTEAMEGLEEVGEECELTLFLPAPEDSPALGQPAVRVGEDIFTVIPMEIDDDDVYLFSIIHPYPGQEDGISFRSWEFPGTGDKVDAEELLMTLKLFRRAYEEGAFESDAGGLPDMLYEIPRLQGLFAGLAETGAEPEFVRNDEGASILISDKAVTVRLSYMSTGYPEVWILVLECEDEKGNKKTFQIPESGGLKDPLHYGKLIETALISFMYYSKNVTIHGS